MPWWTLDGGPRYLQVLSREPNRLIQASPHLDPSLTYSRHTSLVLPPLTIFHRFSRFDFVKFCAVLAALNGITWLNFLRGWIQHTKTGFSTSSSFLYRIDNNIRSIVEKESKVQIFIIKTIFGIYTAINIKYTAYCLHP